MQFHTKICDLIEDREDLNLTIVANKIGVSKQYMSKFKHKGTIGFYQLLKLSYILCDEGKTATETMVEWCLELDTAEAVKHSFEYACLTRNIPLLKQLLEKHKQETGTILEYVKVYTVLYKYIVNELPGNQIINELKPIGHPKDKILEILMEIMKCYGYYHLKKFNLMLETIEQVERQVKDIDGDRKLFIKECYLYRIAEVFAPVFLQRNNTYLARKYAESLINTNACLKTVSDAFYIIGMSYLCKDKEKSLEFLKKSYNIAKTINDDELIKEARFNLDVAKIYLGIELEDDSDPRLALYQKDPKSELSINSLQDIIDKEGEKDFLYFFIAASSKSPTALYEQFQTFFYQSNFLFSSIVARELCNRGDSSLLTQSMVDFGNVKYKGVVGIEEDNISNLYIFNSNNSSIFV
ncbi:AimR family lysis-lysogeny pheromone receptor [Bacillus sp. UNC322MFChir4.1]|uniref:AimR family lysis-lysogeny pheromone receptor n=1 Tax=Bacillus sp. UNC322MFChir4.1 TaxID=1449045 RepID=UPI000556EDE9|nr:AimR family lysis-lysogeny pheromone receptor [Bacillus sp. UNC322MFChir4.1]